MQRRSPAEASGSTRHALVLALAVLVVAAASLVAARCLTRPPRSVWTLRGPDAPGFQSLTVHSGPAGDAIPGRWVFLDEGPGGAVPRVVLVRLPLRAADGDDAIARLVAGGEVVYRPTGRTLATPGALWFSWLRD